MTAHPTSDQRRPLITTPLQRGKRTMCLSLPEGLPFPTPRQSRIHLACSSLIDMLPLAPPFFPQHHLYPLSPLWHRYVGWRPRLLRRVTLDGCPFLHRGLRFSSTGRLLIRITRHNCVLADSVRLSLCVCYARAFLLHYPRCTVFPCNEIRLSVHQRSHYRQY